MTMTAAYIIRVAEVLLTGEPLLKRKVKKTYRIVSSVCDKMRERFQCVNKVVLVVDFLSNI